jgi:hypothetical protein
MRKGLSSAQQAFATPAAYVFDTQLSKAAWAIRIMHLGGGRGA